MTALGWLQSFGLDPRANRFRPIAVGGGSSLKDWIDPDNGHQISENLRSISRRMVLRVSAAAYRLFSSGENGLS